MDLEEPFSSSGLAIASTVLTFSAQQKGGTNPTYWPKALSALLSHAPVKGQDLKGVSSAVTVRGFCSKRQGQILTVRNLH